VKTRQGVNNGVNVGAHGEAVHLDVVADVYDRHDVRGIHSRREELKESSRTDSTA
jgi:hypothetical protein